MGYPLQVAKGLFWHQRQDPELDLTPNSSCCVVDKVFRDPVWQYPMSAGGAGLLVIGGLAFYFSTVTTDPSQKYLYYLTAVIAGIAATCLCGGCSRIGCLKYNSELGENVRKTQTERKRLEAVVANQRLSLDELEQQSKQIGTAVEIEMTQLEKRKEETVKANGLLLQENTHLEELQKKYESLLDQFTLAQAELQGVYIQIKKLQVMAKVRSDLTKELKSGVSTLHSSAHELRKGTDRIDQENGEFQESNLNLIGSIKTLSLEIEELKLYVVELQKLLSEIKEAGKVVLEQKDNNRRLDALLTQAEEADRLMRAMEEGKDTEQGGRSAASAALPDTP